MFKKHVIETSLGQLSLPERFRTSEIVLGAEKCPKGNEIIYDLRIIKLILGPEHSYVGKNVSVPSVRYNSFWSRIAVIYDDPAKHNSVEAFVQYHPPSSKRRAGFLERNPLPLAIDRAVKELSSNQNALLYGELSGRGQDRRKVLKCAPVPNDKESYWELLMIIMG